jgi:hypothetical protein
MDPSDRSQTARKYLLKPEGSPAYKPRGSVVDGEGVEIQGLNATEKGSNPSIVDENRAYRLPSNAWCWFF